MKLEIVHSAQAKTVYDILLENGRWMRAQGIEQWPLDWLASIQNPNLRQRCRRQL